MREIILIDGLGRERASLPIFDVIDLQGGQPFDGQVSRNEALTLRVDFAGPANPYELLKDAQGNVTDKARLRIVLEADNADDETHPER